MILLLRVCVIASMTLVHNDARQPGLLRNFDVYLPLHFIFVGAGQHTKMVNQILISTNMIGVCEGLLYAYK